MRSRAQAVPTILAIACSALLSACQQPAPGQTEQAVPASPSAALSAGEVMVLDQVTTLEHVIPEVSQRELYGTHEAVTENGQRSYTFALKPQPGMDASRHFQIVTVTWGRAGTFAAGATSPDVSGTGGPGGGFVEKIAQTADGTYDIRVAVGELLPNTAKTAPVDPDTVAQRLLNEYSKVRSGQP